MICVECGCKGNVECGKPLQDCSLDECGICPCCNEAIEVTQGSPSISIELLNGFFAIRFYSVGDEIMCKSETLPGVTAFGPTKEKALLGYAIALQGAMECVLEDGDIIYSV